MLCVACTESVGCGGDFAADDDIAAASSLLASLATHPVPSSSPDSHVTSASLTNPFSLYCEWLLIAKRTILSC